MGKRCISRSDPTFGSFNGLTGRASAFAQSCPGGFIFTETKIVAIRLKGS